MTAPLVTRVSRADDAAIGDAVRCLKAGGLVAFPTETVYGLGADATNGRAIARLYAAKGRPAFNPLIAHVADPAAARALARFDAEAAQLAAAFWPGPLTLVLPKARRLPGCRLATAGLDSIAVRVPNHPVAQRSCAAFGKPVVAPSANRSGHVSPTRAAHVLADLRGRIDLILDGGATPIGVNRPSSPASAKPCCCARAALRARRSSACSGSVARRRSAAACRSEETPLAPGMLASHYAPRARLRLEATHVEAGEALLAFGAVLPESAARRRRRAQPLARGDLHRGGRQPVLAAARARRRDVNAIAVMPMPDDGLGEAINDRLRRARRRAHDSLVAYARRATAEPCAAHRAP